MTVRQPGFAAKVPMPAPEGETMRLAESNEGCPIE